MTSYADAVSGWAEHLRTGGTSTWSDWLASDSSGPAQHGHAARDPALAVLPDGLHLELVRRLNELDEPDPALAETVLRTAAPGRGMLEVPLPWPGEGAPRFGTPPIQPDQLPTEELIRMSVGVLARLLPGVPPQPTAEPSPRWPLPGRTRFRVHGSPGAAAVVRAAALAGGAVESDWRPVHLVLARPVESMMAEVWSAHTIAGGILKWEALWRRAAATGGLPPEIDPAGLATDLAARGEAVHVLVGVTAAELLERTAEVVEVEATAADSAAASGADPSLLDLLRRLNRLLALTEGPERSTSVARMLLEVLPVTGIPRQPLTAPGRARRWAAEQGSIVARRLTDPGPNAGYAVHGDPLALTLLGSGASSVDTDRTLGLALAACLRAWQLQRGTPRKDRR